MSLRRLYGLCAVLVLLAGVVLCRTYWVGQQAAYAASAGGQTVQTLDLPRARGDFYDRNGRKLTGTQTQYYALCIPGDDGYTALFPYVSYEKQGVLYDRRNLAAPFLIEVSRDLTGRGIATCAVPAHTVDIAPHLLGYLDGEGRGVAGLERAYDALLTACGDKRTVSCVLAAHSGLMAGTSPVWATREEGTGQGVQLTLDADLQRACEALAAQLMPRGCILIMDAATGEVLASVSAPTFDAQDVAASIRADDTSLINRPFAAFSAGSVFKVVLAAAAYEQGLDWFTHDCTGEIVVAGQTYRCAQGRAHGEVNLRGALEESCNTYFIKLGQLLGAEAIRDEAEHFGFGTAVQIAPGLAAAAGTLPDAETLENPGQLATFSFGQGSLTVTPLQITAMMNTIANGGVYRAPCLLDCALDETSGEELSAFARPQAERVLTEQTAAALRTMLEQTVAEGTAQDASGLPGGAAGKTGTAQTGQFTAEGKERKNLWFAGVYPAEDPQYTIVVLQDGQTQAAVSSAAVFAQLCTALHWLG